MKRINLQLTADNTSFLTNLSSSNYENLLFETFLPADLLLTFFFRYPRLVSHDVPADNTTNGAAVDFTNAHPLIGCFALLAVGGFAALNAYREYRKQKRAQQQASYGYLYSQLQAETNDANTTTLTDAEAKAVEALWLTNYVKNAHATDAALAEQYETITCETSEQGELQLQFIVRQTPGNKPATQTSSWFRRVVINKVISPVWEALAISSFAYWLLWMSSGVVRGEFDVGVGGVSASVGFGVPLLLGAGYLALKTYHWVKNRGKQTISPTEATPAETAQAKKDACCLVRKALLERQFEHATTTLKNELGADYKEPAPVQAADYAETLDQHIHVLAQHKNRRAATTFVSKTMSTYVGVQYAAWITTDILAKVANIASAIPVVNVVCGWAFLAGSAVYGAYKAVKTYREVGVQRQALQARVTEDQENVQSLESVYHEKRAAVAAKQKALQQVGGKTALPKTVSFDESQFFTDVKRQGETRWTKVKKAAVRALHFFNGITTGAFVARIFAVKGTAVFLPFAAAAFSNPITIGIVAGVGVAYGLFKAYEYHQAQKETRAKKLLNEYAERLTCLRRQIEVADLSLQVLDKRLTQAASQPVVTAAPAPRVVRRNSLLQPLLQATTTHASTSEPTPRMVLA